MIVVLALLGCLGPPAPAVLAPDRVVTSVRVEEAWDVPPPPGQRTVRVRGIARRAHVLGASLTLLGADGEVLAVGDLVDDDPLEPSITLYVPEDRADALLDASAMSAR